MAYTGVQLLTLQSSIKRDAEGYKDEFLLQHKHYQAQLEIFLLQPSNEAREFGELATFVAQVSKWYPKETAGFAGQLMGLLDAQAAALDPPLRRSLVQALILLRNRNQVDPLVLLPALFRLFRAPDKALRALVFRHIVADLKASNAKARNERLNRAVQNFLYALMRDDNEPAAKKALAVATELWRRNIWRDARTVNCIASAASNPSPRILLASMKFFMGQEEEAGEGDASDDDAGDAPGSGGKGGGGAAAAAAASGPSREEVYKAFNKGTKSSKRKKQNKLKRVVLTLKKAARREAGAAHESFAAVHLLHDPQAFAEGLFGRLQGGGLRYETRLAVLSVLSRVVGVHKLLLLNLYPYLQKYAAPHTRDVTVVLAALVQAAHDLVPPETLAPVLRQLVDQFVHDRARPEVMTTGLRAVRELCLRCPLVMGDELLQDLALYRKFRDKEVATSARALVALFREINPALLAKRDRGRGADLEARPQEYGQQQLAQRVEGAALLQEALLTGRGLDSDSPPPSDSDEDAPGGAGGGSDSGDDDDDDGGASSSSLDGEAWEEEEEEEEGEEAVVGSELGSEAEAAAAAAAASGDEDCGEDGAVAAASASGGEDAAGGGEEGGGGGAGERSGAGGGRGGDEGVRARRAARARSRSGGEAPSALAGGGAGGEEGGGKGAAAQRGAQAPQAGSLADLKRQLAAAKAAAKAAAAAAEGGREAAAGGAAGEAALLDDTPLEGQRILGPEDFAAIQRLRHRRLVEAAMAKHGLKTASAAKQKRLREVAEEEAEEALALADARAKAADKRVDPDQLLGRHKKRKTKEERMASVLAGREDREGFGARAGRKKQKAGGTSEREKRRQKQLPLAAHASQMRNRMQRARNKKNPRNFKGHVKS